MCLYIITTLLRWAYIWIFLMAPTQAFWDLATTTIGKENTDDTPRQSFFRWQYILPNEYPFFWFWFNSAYDLVDNARRRGLSSVAGLSIDFLPLGVASILNRRCLITSANFLEPYQHRQLDLRIWALGKAGRHVTPFRYRVWRVRRVIPKSNNPEHYHGSRGLHVPRHDVAIVHSRDQMLLVNEWPSGYWHYAAKVYLAGPRALLTGQEMTFAGSGYEYLQHIRENYKIFYGIVRTEDIVNCEKYLPKWWGKFICFKNRNSVAGLPNGGPLNLDTGHLVGLGCFEIRYNEDRIFVFTDLRYYWVHIHHMANHTPSEYYEYAYPQWYADWSWKGINKPGIQAITNLKHDIFPLGK